MQKNCVVPPSRASPNLSGQALRTTPFPYTLGVPADVDSVFDGKPHLGVFHLVESGTVRSFILAFTNEPNTFHANHVVGRGTPGSRSDSEAVNCELTARQLT
ncbi:hypothetical protein D9M71_837440 [compost metagenome]